MRTRSQNDLILAERLVSAVAKEPQEVRDIYGGLCHQFPVLVRTCGLCQAVAFSLSKSAAETNRAKAHRLILIHVGEILGQTGDPTTVVAMLREADTMTYLRNTRRVLDALLFFKRFAVSVLKVETAEAARDDND